MSSEPRLDLRGIQPIVVDLAIRLGFLGLFAWLSFQMIAPFAPLLMWAAILAVALHPLYAWLCRRLGGRRTLAASLLTVVGLAAIAGPILALMASLIKTIGLVVDKIEAEGLSLQPPAWVADIPLVGKQIVDAWTSVVNNLGGFAREFGPVLADVGGWFLRAAGSIGGAAIFFVLAILLSGVLMVIGGPMVGWGRRFAVRVVGARGDVFMQITGATIRNVARGVIGVALLQSLLTGAGLLVAGVPGAGLITLAALVLSIVQIGAWPVVYPVVIWAWLELDTTTALLLTLYLLPVGMIDNVLKPIVMSQGLQTPMLVILFGVIGGTVAYGLVGLFVGPMVLALFWELLSAWLGPDQTEPAGEPAESGSTGGPPD